jgi:hypothetical protein
MTPPCPRLTSLARWISALALVLATAGSWVAAAQVH